MCLPFSNLVIDTIYFDNTYSRKAASFLTREECKQESALFCRSEIGSNKIVYFVLEPIGKEDILASVAETLGVRIVVPEDKYQLLSCMGLCKNFTVDKKDGLIFYISKSKFNFKKSSKKIIDQHSPKEVVFVKISGMRRGQNCKSYKYVNFSEHSSMKEIEMFFDSVVYKSATPILTRIEREKSEKVAKALTCEDETQEKKQSNEKVKVKLRKNKSSDEQTSFTITSEFERSVAVTPCYRVVTGVSTDEEAGDSPGAPGVLPPRSCSTPMTDINDDELEKLAVFHDYSSLDLAGSTEASDQMSVSSSPCRGPYIEPPIALDWVLSPIKSTLSSPSSLIEHPILQLENEYKRMSSPDSPYALSICSSIEVLIESELVNKHQKKVSPNKGLVLSPYDVGMICNSPIYDMNGKVSYPSVSPTIEREYLQNLSNSSLQLDGYQSNAADMYEKMFKEPEVPPEITASLVDDLRRGVDIMDDTPNSIDTLYVSDTESESEDEMEKDGPIGDYLRGQYALNQMFNNSVIDIRESLSTSVRFANHIQQQKRSTEEDLAKTKIELLMPKIRGSAEIQKEQESNSIVEHARQIIESKDDYFRKMTEIAERGYQVSYNKKPKKIGKTLPQNLLTESINLINNYAELSDGSLKNLARKLTYDDTFNPRNKPVLSISRKAGIPAEVFNMSYPVPHPVPLLSPQPAPLSKVPPPLSHTKYCSPKPPYKEFTCLNSHEVLGHDPICYPRSLNAKTPKFQKLPGKQNLSSSSSPLVRGTRHRQKHVKNTIHSPKQPDDIFDILFGSTPTSAVKRVKKRAKEQNSCKREKVRQGSANGN